MCENIDTANKEFQDALHLVQYTRQSVFLTGKAGTGKSTFLRYICEQTKKKHVVLAPTGIAAINAGGATLHSFFRLPFRPVLPNDPEYSKELGRIYKTLRYSADQITLIRELELIIIDEISMVRADVIDLVDRILRVYTRRPRDPFGGKQVLLVGDVYQLEPVVKSDEREILNRFYPSPYFFHARVFREFGLVSIELKTVYRQTDAVFVRLLDKIRANSITDQELQLLNMRHQEAPKDEELRITLATRRDNVDYINQQKLGELPDQPVVFRGQINGEFPETALPTLMELELKVGAQVIFIKNDPEKLFVNGTIGVVIDFDLEEGAITVQTENGSLITVKQAIWRNIRYRYNEEKKEIEEEELGQFVQFPLKLAWAITVHKSQGLTFEKVNIDFTGGVFAAGQTYVALSRCRSLEGIRLFKPVTRSDVFVNSEVVSFSTRFNNTESIQRALTFAKADLEYKASIEAFDKRDFEASLEHLFVAIHERYDLERPRVKRLIRYKLGVIHRLHRENSELRQREAERLEQLRKLAAEYYLMGNECRTQIKDSEAALRNYEKALLLDPKHVDALVAKGLIYFKKGDELEALHCFNQAAKLSPLSLKARYNRGRAHLALNHVEEALSDLLKAVSIKPEHAASHKGLGDVYSRMEDEERAELHWRIAEELRKKKDK